MQIKTRMRARRYVLVAIAFCFIARIPSASQSLLLPQDLPRANNILDNAPKRKSLRCDMGIGKYPKLDFSYRYLTGFWISCPFGIFQPGETLVTLIRIKSEKREPVLMTTVFEVPRPPPGMSTSFYSVPLNKLQVSMSGGFAMGPGRYSVEMLLVDQRGHSCRVVQSLKVGEDKKERLLSTLSPGSVAPLVETDWNGKLVSSGLRLTMLLLADPGDTRLWAYQRAYLLRSLAALLDDIPCRSVKLIVANLDEQNEIFRQEQFDKYGFLELKHDLERVQFGTIPYQVLRKGSWSDFLLT